MRKHFLFTVLVVPLTLGAAVLMVTSFGVSEPWRSLFVNLAAGLLGSVITVFYIDKILRRNEQYKWTKVRGHVGKQVNILANATSSSLRQALGIKLRISPSDFATLSDSPVSIAECKFAADSRGRV